MNGINIRSKVFFIVVCIVINMDTLFAQDFSFKDTLDISLRGFNNENLIFRTNQNNKFLLVSHDSINLKTLPNNEDRFYFYFSNRYIVYYQKSSDLVVINSKNKDFEFTLKSIYNFVETENSLFFTCVFEDGYFEQIGFVNEDKNIGKILPIAGRVKFVTNNSLYFEADYLSDSFSTPPNDIFKLNISNWKDFELIYSYVSEDKWYLSEDLSYLYTGNYQNFKQPHQHLVYSFKKDKYALIDEQEYDNLIHYNNRFYKLKEMQNNGVSEYRLISLSKLENLNFEIDSINEKKPSRNKYINVPWQDRVFKDSFLSEYMLYDASKQELRSLSSQKLRLLRNAIFAKYGYVFKDESLNNFFIKNDWYKQMIGYSKNNYIAIELSDSEKERVQMIKSIE